MSYGEQQKKEIETIKGRQITLNLSDADCDRITELCGRHDMTVSQLLENFIGDLVCGTYSNGSDERMYADQWFNRCWFGMFPDPTLLKFLLEHLYTSVDDFMDLLENIEDAKKDLAEYEENPDSDYWDEEEIEYTRTDLEDWNKELEEIKTEFLEEKPSADWEEEVAKVKNFIKSRDDMREGYTTEVVPKLADYLFYHLCNYENMKNVLKTSNIREEDFVEELRIGLRNFYQNQKG